MYDSLETHLRIAGTLLIGLALLHSIFPMYFNWKKELESLSLINKQMMIVHTFFIAFVVLLMGLLCTTSYTELLDTKLGKTVLLGFALFWSVRLFIQFLGYSSSLWKGKIFETFVHITFSSLWLYLCVIFWSGYFR